MTLWPHQETAAGAATLALAEGKSGCIVMATGTGKTRTARAVVERLARPTLWLTAQTELVRQAQAELGDLVTAATVQSKPTGTFGLVVVDEAHNFLSEKRTAFVHAFGCPVLGLTATPEQGDGRSVFDAYGRPFSEPYSLAHGIADGVLVDCRMVAFDVEGVDLAQVKIRGEDFDTESLAKVMNQADVTSRIVDTWLAHREGLANFYAVTTDHADSLAEELLRRGVRAASIHRAMGKRESDRRLEAFRGGEYEAIASVQLVTEGFDHRPLQTLVNCRPMRSRRLYIQCLGRALRQDGGKERALWLDAGGTSEHVADVRRVLEPTEKPPRELSPTPRPTDALLSDVLVESRELGMLSRIQARGFHRVDLDGRALEACMTSRGVLVIAHDPRGGFSVSHVEQAGIRSVAREVADETVAWTVARSWLSSNVPDAYGREGKAETLRRLRELMRHHQPPTPAQVYVLKRHNIDVPKTHAQAQRAIRRIHACAR